MTKDRSALQTAFFAHVSQRRLPVAVSLLNGARVRGVVAGCDDYTVHLVTEGTTQTIYKHAIAAIASLRPIDPRRDRFGQPQFKGCPLTPSWTLLNFRS